ncbi:MAG: MarR family EPS-associated transcriptional regulator [Halioglobus sp.]
MNAISVESSAPATFSPRTPNWQGANPAVACLFDTQRSTISNLKGCSMPSNQNLSSKEEVRLNVLRLLQQSPQMSQREIASSLDVSLGGINYCLRALVDKGWVKVENFSKSEQKLRYAYLLTPKGVTEKSKLTAQFLKRKLTEYETLKQEIAALEKEVDTSHPGQALETS